ncbi:DUF4867 family protein [Clostridium beijerinckii]|uniref:DUF4867 family protein n=1 Tax=Clostridium beijerinckii TaxID=1520 RepID=UPI0022E08B0C|nr:DUF4867 family protein [Clostridium beijerinckii]
MNLDKLKEINSHIEIKLITDESFLKYGRIVDEYDFTTIINYMNSNTSIPLEGNVYVASIDDMECLEIKDMIEKEFYGEMPIEIGYCNGRNSTLNGLEYHKGSEINVAVTDMVLLLGKVQDIHNNSYESNKIEAFFVPEGTAIEMYQTTLHFGPCKTSDEGFKCVVILPKGTNLPLDREITKNSKEKLLFAKNKWLLVHSSRTVLIEKGAHVGIKGENIEIKSIHSKKLSIPLK